jgi:hypothetical protein
MKLLELCLISLILVVTDTSEADTTVKSYTRKNGTEVPSYTRHSAVPDSNGDSNVTTPESQPVQVYVTPEIPVEATPSAQTLSPAEVLDNELAAGLPASTDVISSITSNQWRSDTLVVHGTLINTSSGSVNLTTPALLGFDAKGQEISAGKIILANPELKAGQKEAFTAEMSDPKKAIKFTKLVGIRASYHIATESANADPTPFGTATPYAATAPPWYPSATPIQEQSTAASPQSASSGNTLGGIIGFVVLGTIGVCVIKFLLKLSSRILSPVATPTS